MSGMNGTPMNGTAINGTHSLSMSATGDHHDERALQAESSGPTAHEPWPDVAHDELKAERMRLEAEIANAKSRAATARHRAAVRDTEMRDALRAEIAASKEALTAMEREHETTISMVRGAAQAEVDRILAAAQQVAAGMNTPRGGPEQEQVHHAE